MNDRAGAAPPPAPRRAERSFARRVLHWYARHGRKNLPWQEPATPYRVWVSEIMLQQTQVATVERYFERFVLRFPGVRALADASLDEVLHLWSGLGYYARARNLHRAARVVRDDHAGALPSDSRALAGLPGIGRSTAAAILALALGQRQAILDGNVKRVLCRYHAVRGWPGHAAVEKRLWSLAEGHLPVHSVAAYTQAMMDLGATVCLRRNPACGTCPLAGTCAARRQGLTALLPEPRPVHPLVPVRRRLFLLLVDGAGRVLLERRPPAGVWGGLWSFPECAPEAEPAAECARRYGLRTGAPVALPERRHRFTHFELLIAPRLVEVEEAAGAVLTEAGERLWYDPVEPAEVGLAAPVAELARAAREHKLKQSR